jgi:tetratricopeptide (TPR) repeat protein
MPLKTGSRVGPYEIVSAIGAGGMGEVYLAVDSRLDRRVAVKGLPAHLLADPVARERLRREALSSAALDHPFICKVFELVEEPGATFIVMEYVDGETLHQRLSAGPLPLADGLRVAGEMADALEAAHAQRIVHRDLKPGNVMLTQQGRVKVMDFGLARQAAGGAVETMPAASGRAPLTEHGMRVGTPDYMSPEQALGEDLDERSDLFSFGIVVCEMLTGSHPFRRTNSVSTLSAIVREAPAFESSAALPPAVVVILRKLLAKAPGDRYQSISDVRRDLAAISGISASAPTVPSMGRGSTRFPLVGRDSERAELLNGLDAALTGRGSLVMISGEPGIGKTRLTADVLAEARQRGFFCLAGHCYEMEGAPPYVPFIEMLEYSARYVPPAAFRHALGDAAPAVSKLMPELRRVFPDVAEPLALPPEQQRRYLFNAYLEFVERSCRNTPIAVVLEDLHWADEPTLMLLQHVAQGSSSLPIFIMATYRDVELGVTRPFARTLETLLRERRATRIALRRLPVEAVETMLASMSGHTPPPSLARVIFDETEGNPFFVEEVFQHLAEEGKLFDAAGNWQRDLRAGSLEVPEGVRLVIGRRLQRLGDAARATLTTAAIVGRTFSLRLLEAIETNPDVVLDAIEEAERAQLLVAEPSGRDPRYRFAHELIRQTLAESVSLPRRQRQHARIAEAMERLYGAAAEKHAPALAHHLYQAGAAADADKTTKYLLAAAAQARVASGFEEALAHLENALSLWEGARTATVAGILLERGALLASVGRAADAHDAYRSAIDIFEALGDVEGAAAATVRLSWALLWDAKPSAVVPIGDRAMKRLGTGSPVLSVRLLLARALAEAGLGRTREALDALAEADALRGRIDDPRLEDEALAAATHVHWSALQVERARDTARRVADRASAAGDEYGFAEVKWMEGAALIHLGRFAEAVPILSDLMPRAERIGHLNVGWICRTFLAHARMAAADFGAAERMTEEALSYSEAYRVPWRFFDHQKLGVLAMWRGDPAAATMQLRTALDVEPPTYWFGLSRSYLFYHLAEQGDGTALDVVRTAPPPMPVPGQPAPAGAWLSVAPFVRGLALLGRHDEVAALVPATESLLASGLVGYYWSSTTAAAIAAAAAGDWTTAEDLHRQAIAQADGIPNIPWQPDARDWYARMLVDRGAPGDTDRARELLGDAIVRYEALGMPTYAQRAGDRAALVLGVQGETRTIRP